MKPGGCLTLEKELAGLLGETSLHSFRRGNLGNSKEGNLHTFKKTDNAHEDEENSSPLRDTFPHGGLALE
jgi:hypothetical protein